MDLKGKHRGTREEMFFTEKVLFKYEGGASGSEITARFPN